MTADRTHAFDEHTRTSQRKLATIARNHRSVLVAFMLSLLLAACQATPIDPAPDPDPDPDPTPDPGPLTVSVRDYYATDGTRTLVLVDIIASHAVSLEVVADCFLHSPPSMSFARYAGTISVGTLGSNRSLAMSGTAPWPGASTISCTITGNAGDGASVTVTVR